MEEEKGDIYTAYENGENGSATGSGTVETGEVSRFQRFKDSFKSAHFDEEEFAGLSQVERAALATSQSPLSKSLKPRHVQMIAIGGSIGTGLFIGSGSSLATGGPANVLLSYAVVASALYATIQSLGVLSTNWPVAGSFNTFATRFLGPHIGFAVGTNYALQWLAAAPLEIVCLPNNPHVDRGV